MFPANPLDVNEVEFVFDITVAPLMLLPKAYDVPSTGPGLGAVALVLLTTRYLFGVGEAAVKEPAIELEVIVPNVNDVGCAVGVTHGRVCVTQIVKPFAVSSPLKS